MKALTVHQPWGWAMFHAGKDVENRTWLPPKKLLGELLAIHAGQKYSEQAAEWIRTTFGIDVPGPKDVRLGAVIGTVRVAGVANDLLAVPPRGRSRHYFFGPFGWLLEDPVEVTPFRCPGAQGLWELPDSVREHLLPIDAAAADRQAERYLAAKARAG